MAETTHRVAGQLTYRLHDGVLYGLVGGRQIHSLTSRPGGAVMKIAPRRYGLTKPTQHPVFGIVAFACPSDPSRPGGATAWDMRPGGTNAYDLRPGASAYDLRPAGTHSYDLRPGGASAYDLRPGGAKAYDLRPGANGTAGGFVLAKSSLGGNSLIVINGFEELMDALTHSGGGSFDVVT